jgi:hypothetical protein
MDFTALAWQLPAMFTAVPMLHRLLPFKLPERCYPLFYFLVCFVVIFLPGRVDLALGAAGLLSMIHVRLGEHMHQVDPPDMKEVANKLALGWDYIVTYLQRAPWSRISPATRKAPTVHDRPDDDNSDDGSADYQEPPSPPEQPIARIPRL